MAKRQRKEIEYSSMVYDKPFEDVMHSSMIPYSESVILDRALPRVEDGLKPVQRRILYSMHEMGLTPDKPYKKSARIVGDCLGKYHPHGDSSVYGAMVRMAQPFAMRMKLVDGHGNFGSNDGDSAAAMRYTEARMSPLALWLLKDLDKDTVSWNSNFDDSLEEPNMLPGRFPNLLVNGASGIAVGLATNIPPHNMGESIDAVVAMIDNPQIGLSELLTIVKGPDFPTGGFIVPVDPMEQIYKTGKGRIKIRSRIHMEDEGNGKKAIVITEMPYQVSKADLLAKIAGLRDNNKDALSSISEIVDESDKNGMRAVIRCKKDADINKIIAFLFKKTNLELSYAINMVAIANGKPEQLGLREILRYYIDYQRQVIIRRTNFDLKAAKKRYEIVKGLMIAIENIDEVIRIIKTSESTQKARKTLMEKFALSEEQAQAILDMRLKALARLEVNRLAKELEELEKKIEKLSAILASRKLQNKVIKDEILEIRRNMDSSRMSIIIGENNLNNIDIPTEEEAIEYREGVLALNNAGTLRFMSQKTFSLASKAMEKYGEKELPVQALTVHNKGDLFAFTNYGNLVKVNVTELPEKKWKEKGATLVSVNPEATVGERIIKLMFFNSTPVGEIVMYTKNGMVKRTDLNEFAINKSFIQAIILNGKDELVNVEMVEEDKNIIEITKGGQALVYTMDEVSVQGKKAAGVRGIKLNDKDTVVYAGQFEEEGEIVIMSSKGYTKRVISSTLDPISRYSKGVKIIDLDKSDVFYVSTVKMPYDIAVATESGTTILNTEKIRIDTRTTKGKQLFKMAIKMVTKLEYQV